MADLFKITLVDGVTTYYWTSWDNDLLADGHLYSSRKPWIKRSKWNTANTMQVPELTLYLLTLATNFEDGLTILAQLNNGLFDGATFQFSRAYMDEPGNTAALGTILLMGGVTSTADITAAQAVIKCKGKTNLLAQNVPHDIFQTGCNHAFCDPGCTLSAAAFTFDFAVGASPDATFLPWAGTPPSNAANYIGGSVTFTSGVADGESQTIQAADSTGLTLAYPLIAVPSAGDTFAALQGCDKTYNSGTTRSCTARANTQHYRGFEFVPPPNTAY